MALFPSFVDRQFARFCRSGDPHALGAVFDRTAPELLRIACYLSGNRTDAEDLVQRTFLAAIERRAAFASERRALPWLCGILANHARRLQQERARARQQTLPDEPATADADPIAGAVQRELAERLATLRAELGAPYADVLLLHLEQGLDAKEIAARLQRPAGTVRTQLMRALALLRERLPNGFVAGGLLTLLGRPSSALAPAVAAIRQVVVQAAGPPLATSAFGAAVAVTGSWLVSKKIVVVASSLLLAIVLWQVWPGAVDASPPAGTPREAVAAASSRPAVPEPAAATDPGPRVDAAPRGLVATPAAAAAPFATLVVRAVRDGQPVPNLGVFADRGHSNARRDAVTDADGTAELVHLRPGPWSVDTTLGANGRRQRHPPLHVDLLAGERREVVLDVTTATTCHGLVVDAQDRPVAAARIWVSVDGDDTHGHELAVSSADGTFAVAIAGVHYVGARKHGFAPSHVIRAKTNEPGAPLRLQLQPGGGTVRGRVQDERGDPIAFAKVLVGAERPEASHGARRADHEFVPRGVEVASAPDGTFVADGVPVGLMAVQAWAAGKSPLHTAAEVPARGAVDVVLTLHPGAEVRGIARDATDAPIAEVVVAFGSADQFAHTHTTSAADGSYVLLDLPAGPCQLRAARGGARAATTQVLAAGATTTWDPRLGIDGTLRGRVVDERGVALADYEVAAWHGDDQRSRATSGADGTFTMSEVGGEPLRLEVSRDFQSLLQQADVQPGRSDVVLTLTDANRPSAFFTGRFVDEQGHPAQATIMPWHSESQRVQHYQTDPATGAYRIGPLRPGRYALDVDTASFGRQLLGKHELAANETRDLGDFVLRTPGTAELTVTIGGRPAAGGRVAFRRADGTWIDAAAVEQGVTRHTTLPPGIVQATAEYQGMVAACELAIVAGATAHGALDLQRPFRATTTLHDPRGRSREELAAQLIARRTDGAFAGQFRAVGLPGPSQFFVELPPGEYSLHVVVADGRTIDGRVDLRAGPCAVALTLPQ